jgi:hypothetical protein
MEEYHGIIVDASQKDKSVFNKLKILGKKEDDGWVLYKIEASSSDLPKLIKELQENTADGFYFHFYRNDELIVAFNHKAFNVGTDRKTWKKIIAYGKSLNIPEQQLDFYACKVEEEDY